MVKMEFPLLEVCLPAYSFVDTDNLPECLPFKKIDFSLFLVIYCQVLLVN